MASVEVYRSDPIPCAYLSGLTTTQEYSITPRLTGDVYERLMDAGYRKFGMVLFRPVCEGCNACRPIRIPIAQFTPTRSQRRCLTRNRDLEIRIGPPILDAERIDLYNRYHAAQVGRCGWEAQTTDETQYSQSFVLNPLPSFELTLWDRGKLIGIAHNDVTPNVVSAIYHFYDPEYESRGLGTYLILNVLNTAQMMGKTWVYMGYFVAGCRSMEYKKNYRPCEIMNTLGVWETAASK